MFSVFEGGDGLNELNFYDFVVKIIYWFCLSVGLNEDDNFVERFERVIAKNLKEFKVKYVGVYLFKVVKWLEFIL